MLFDTHCHLNFNLFNHDVHKVIKDTLQDDIWMLVIGTNKKNSARAQELASEYLKGVYASIGIHPVHLTRQKINEGGIEFMTSGDDFDNAYFRGLITDSLQGRHLTRGFGASKQSRGRVVAVGETGLDYFYTVDPEIIEHQRHVFVGHMRLADEMLLPLIIHARGERDKMYQVYDDLIKLLEQERLRLRGRLRGVVHSFYGTLEQAEQLIEMGLFIGINASIKNDDALSQVVRTLDLDHLLLETDAPYFHPSLDTSRRNSPKNVQMVSEYVAKIKNYSVYEVSEVTTQNALHLFGIVC